MKALILNSGVGRRMGELTKSAPKCFTELSSGETILGRQLKLLADAGIRKAVITTGGFDSMIRDYCASLSLPIEIEYVRNPLYDQTNYIYSIYCAAALLRNDDLVFMHGDLVFEPAVLDAVIRTKHSCMAVDFRAPIPEKDFKAVIESSDKSENGRITKIGVEFFGSDAVAAQPLYKFLAADWQVWLDEIIRFCEAGNQNCYAENAFNNVSDSCSLYPFDLNGALCSEIDNPEDLARVSADLDQIRNRSVYLCFSTDFLHGGHIEMLKKARSLGRLTVGVLSDEAVANYRRFPLTPFAERKLLFENIQGVERVVEQKTIDYTDNLRNLKPDIVVHGDDWRTGFQKSVRDGVLSVLSEYGGRLVEFPYSYDSKYAELEKSWNARLSIPEIRRGRLRKLIELKGCVTALEAHSGITGLIAEKTRVLQDGKTYQFDAMWVSSLCDSTAKGKPDIELVDMTSRFRTIDDIMEVTTKPIIFDGDTGGLTEHFVYTVKSLERMGVSMVIIEDKTGLKKNSLFGTEVEQTQDTIERFSEKIAAGKKAQKTPDFMICARIESLILEKGVDDALTRADAFTDAGADAVMIHSRKKDPAEIFEFVERFRAKNTETPIVVVPTTFNSVTEQQFKERGVNVVIYANQLTRSGFPAMRRTAETILRHHRALEADAECMPIKEILTLIPR